MSGIEAAFFGTLSRDVELKTSKAGKQYLRLIVRVGDGDAAQWVSVTSFDPDAIAAIDKLVKGARVYAEGSLTLQEWKSADGSPRHDLNVLSWHTRLAQIGRPRAARVSVASGTAMRTARHMRQRTASDDEFHNDSLTGI
jgi:single-stranded DNA-binding protein